MSYISINFFPTRSFAIYVFPVKSFPTIEQASTFYKTEKQEYAKRLVSKWEDVLDIKIKNKLLNYTADND